MIEAALLDQVTVKVDVVPVQGATVAGESIELGDGVFTSADLALQIEPTLTPFSYSLSFSVPSA